MTAPVRPPLTTPVQGPPARPPRPVWVGDAVRALAAAMLLLAWDASGGDLALARYFGNADGFVWQHAFWTARVAHDGGRWLAGLTLAGLIASAWRPVPPGPGAAERWRWVVVIAACWLLVPALKWLSPTSCPWDLAMFGGHARYLSHWRWATPDGGPGHCFPSGHATAAFAFVGQYFLWRRHRPSRAHGWLVAVTLCGAVFGLAQLARGAHFPSHTLWSAWLCWVVCALADALWARPDWRGPLPR